MRSDELAEGGSPDGDAAREREKVLAASFLCPVHLLVIAFMLRSHRDSQLVSHSFCQPAPVGFAKASMSGYLVTAR